MQHSWRHHGMALPALIIALCQVFHKLQYVYHRLKNFEWFDSCPSFLWNRLVFHSFTQDLEVWWSASSSFLFGLLHNFLFNVMRPVSQTKQTVYFKSCFDATRACCSNCEVPLSPVLCNVLLSMYPTSMDFCCGIVCHAISCVQTELRTCLLCATFIIFCSLYQGLREGSLVLNVIRCNRAMGGECMFLDIDDVASFWECSLWGACSTVWNSALLCSSQISLL